MKQSLGRIVRKSNVQQRTTINAFKDKGKTNAKPQARAQTQGNFHRGFKEMIEWRREREKRERLIRNKKLMDTLKNNINPRFQLADIRAFTLPASPETAEWKDLGLREDLTRGLIEGLKLKKPLPSQITGIPTLLKLKTGLFAAPTGCGKTLSYLLPLMQSLKNEETNFALEGEASRKGPRSLILVPTHELVRQVYSVAKALGHYAKMRIETTDTVFKYKDPKASSNLDILISTPRSLLKNRLEEGPFKIRTDTIKRVVVDEADTLLSADFAVDVKEILSNLAADPRVLATSATITRQLQRTLTSLYPEAKIHMTAGLHAALPALRQRFVTIDQPGDAKMQQALKIIMEEPTSRIIVFCNKLAKAESLHKYLLDHMTFKEPEESLELEAGGSNPSHSHSHSHVRTLPSIFHGNLPPIQRSSIIQKFASGAIRVLICTDLAARGLDTPWVNHVINYDFPRSLQDYLHRAGRTARAGRGGAVTSFVTGKDRALFEYIELAAKQRRILSDPL